MCKSTVANINTPTDRRRLASHARGLPDLDAVQSSALPGYIVEFIPAERRISQRRGKNKRAQ